MVRDHLHIKYRNLDDMLSHYKVDLNHYKYCIEQGISLCETLTGVNYISDGVNKFESVRELIFNYNIKINQWHSLIEYYGDFNIVMEVLKKPLMEITEVSEDTFTESILEEYKIEPVEFYNQLKVCKNNYSKTLTSFITSRVIDPFGYRFVSIKTICEYYGISYASFSRHNENGVCMRGILYDVDIMKYRDRNHSELHNILKEVKFYSKSDNDAVKGSEDNNNRSELSTKCYTDHLGNIYNTKQSMVESHGVSLTTFNKRMSLGCSLEQSLTPGRLYLPRDKSKITKFTVKDHLGNIFPTTQAMCDYHGVKMNTYFIRLKRGFSLEEALKSPLLKENRTVVYNGVEYASLYELCKKLSIPYSTVSNRIDKGMSLENALEVKYVQDHKGNKFKNTAEMGRHYGVSGDTYKDRIDRGWTVEKALTSADMRYSVNSPNIVKDHKGNEFNSIIDMCKHYNIKYYIYANRVRRGWTLEQALTIPNCNIVKNTNIRNVIHTVIAPNGKIYSSAKEMCKAYGVSYSTYKYRLKLGQTVKQALLGKNKSEII